MRKTATGFRRVRSKSKNSRYFGFPPKGEKAAHRNTAVFYQVKRLCEADSASIFKFNADIRNKVAYTAVIDRVRPELEAILVGRLVGTVNRIFRRDLRPTGIIRRVDRANNVVRNGFSVRAVNEVAADGILIVTVVVEIL